MRTLALLLLALATCQASAQDTPAAAPASAPAAAPAVPAPQVSLADAYKKEFAFLTAQKRDLGARLAAAQGQLQQGRARLESEVGALEPGMELDARVVGEGFRSQRYAAIVEDGVVTEVKVDEKPWLADASSAQSICGL